MKHNFICIEGNIGSGKTTLTKMLSAENNALAILGRFDENPFLPAFYEDKERFAFPVEVFFLSERHKQMQQELSVSNMFHDIIIADYCFHKTVLFAQENLNDQEYGLFYKLYSQLNQQLIQPELIIYLHRPVESLLKNIAKRNREFEKKIQPEYLSGISQAYLNYFSSIKDIPVYVIHIDDLDFENDTLIYEKIKDIISTDEGLIGRKDFYL